jgi:Arp2/3 complex, 34 kD subunit p34-Arc
VRTALLRIAQADRVTVVYAVDFEELDERALCKVFLAEFPEAQRSANNAPPLAYTPEPPRELQGCKIRGKPVGYLSFGECFLCSLSAQSLCTRWQQHVVLVLALCECQYAVIS